MKKTLFLVPVLLFAANLPLQGQVTQTTEVTEVTEVGPGHTSTTITEVRQLDPIIVERQLSVAPRPVTMTAEQIGAMQPTVAVQPGQTTTVIETQPQTVRRVYNMERNIVIVESEGVAQELPFVTLPVLFEVDTANLLDAESRLALEEIARIIQQVRVTAPNAVFDIEGHASTDGPADVNMQLSIDRAKRIHAELTQRYGVPAELLTAHGYGQNYPSYPEGTEIEKQQDRRVLVVRTR